MAAQTSVRTLSLPCEFAGYRLVREIASGGMGIVYEAEDVKLRRVVALKLIRNAHFATREEAARFRAETQAVAQLDHPDIIPIYESGEEDGMPYFTMRLAEGGSLADRIKKRGVMPDREAATLLSRIARAVQHAHDHGVLHRDLKPANILLDLTGRPMLSDFGLAKLLDAEFQLTRSNAYVGTPHYMSPEQAAGKSKEVTTASDVWALGVMLYQMLTDKLPFQGGSAVEVMRRITQEEPEISSSGKLTARSRAKSGDVKPTNVSASSLQRIQPDLATLILRCLEKQPARRLPGAGFLADELDRFLRGETIQSRPVGTFEGLWKLALRHKAATIGLLATSASLIGGSIISVGHAMKARQAELRALSQKQEAATVAEIILSTVKELDERQTGHEIDPEEMKRQMLKRILDFKGDPVRKAEMLAATASMFKNEACLEHYIQALGLVAPVVGPDDPILWDMRFNVAGQRAVMEDSGDECMTELRRILAWQRQHLGRTHHKTLFTQFAIGKNLILRNEAPEAAELLAEVCRVTDGNAAYFPSHQAKCRLELMKAVFQAGREKEALELGRENGRKALTALGDRHVVTAQTFHRHAMHCEVGGLPDEAITAARRGLDIYWDSVGPEHEFANTCFALLSELLLQKGDTTARLALLREALHVCDNRLGPAHPVTLHRADRCMFVLSTMKKYAEAKELGDDWLERIRLADSSVPPEANGLLRELAYALRVLREPARAEAVLRELISLMEQHQPDDLQRFADLSNLAETLLDQQRPAEAFPLLTAAVQAFAERGETQPKLTAQALPLAQERLQRAVLAQNPSAEND